MASLTWQVETATALATNAVWTPVGLPVAGNNYFHEVRDDAPVAGQRYYRIRSVMP